MWTSAFSAFRNRLSLFPVMDMDEVMKLLQLDFNLDHNQMALGHLIIFCRCEQQDKNRWLM